MKPNLDFWADINIADAIEYLENNNIVPVSTKDTKAFDIFGPRHTLPYPVLMLLGSGDLVDSSWKNDISPSFSAKDDKDNQVRFWVNADFPDWRESPSSGKYVVTVYDRDEAVYDGDSLEAALEAFASCLKAEFGGTE